MQFKTLVGNTPLIKIDDQIYGKLEAYNPTGSVKDRMVSYIVENAINAGRITSTTILVEATSGNTGISLSAICAELGLRVMIIMPSDMSSERKQMMRLFGAQIIDAPPGDFETAIKMRDNLLKDKKYWSPMQFSNKLNIECHKLTTGPEVYRQIGDTWDYFVHGAGTGGTIMGIKQFTQEANLDIKFCLTVPASDNHGIQGIGDGKDFLVNRNEMDDIVEVDTNDAINEAKAFAKKSGITVGISSGANILAAKQILKNRHVSGDIVTILADRGERYMSIF
jgi:cysteine synthase